MVDSKQTQNDTTPSMEEELEAYLKQQTSSQSGMVSHPSNGQDEDEKPIDLLSIISAEDKKNEKDQKKKVRKEISFSKMFTIFMMRATIKWAEIQHRYSAIFSTLKLVWCLLIAFVYIGGIVSLFVLIYSYLNYPRYVSDYLKKSGIEATWDMNEYSLSRIELKNLKSKDGSYSIRRVLIRSDFSDFLKGRIKAVSLEGAIVKIKEKGDKLETGKLIDILMRLNQTNKAEYKIGSISVPGAILNIEGKKYKLPVQLSINGVYEKTPNVSIPITIKQDYMNISALLTMGGTGNNLDWTLEIMSGTLSFPNRQPENISGKFKIKTDKTSLAAINGTFDMAYGKNTKKVKVDLKKNKKVYRGTIGLSLTNKEVRDKADETKTEVQMVFEGLDIKHFSNITSNKPIRFNMQSFYMQDFSVANASGTFRGDLTCKDFACSYEIKANVPVSVQNSRLTHYGNTYVSTERTTFTLRPNKKTSFKIDGNGVQFDVAMADVSYAGTKNGNSNKLEISSKGLDLVGAISSRNQESHMRVQMDEATYASPAVQFEKAAVLIDNIWDSNTAVRFKSPKVSLVNNRLMKVPFSMDMRRENGVMGAVVGLLDNKIKAQYVGTANLLSGSFQGSVVVVPFELSNVKENLKSISDVFPGFATSPKGRLAVYGKINWKSEKQVGGPFYLMMENVGFKAGNIQVNNLNTVLAVQSLVPFVTAGSQEIYIGEINSSLPFRDTLVTLKLDNQMMRIARLSTELNGVSLGVDNLMIPYRSNGTLVYLKNTDVDVSMLDKQWQIDGLTAEGRINVSLPIEVKDNTLSVVNGEIRASNVLLKYTGNNPQIRSALFRKSDEYVLRTGNILLTQEGSGLLNAYLNFEGRMLPDQIKTTYAHTMQFSLEDILKSTSQGNIPASITGRLHAVKKFFKE